MNGMIWTIALVVITSGLCGPQMKWVALGSRALDAGNPRQAAAAFARALDARLRTEAPATELQHLRVTLATAYMEAGQDREAEATLQEAGKSAAQLADGFARAELLNAWSALHLKQGRLSAAEQELKDTWQIVALSPVSEDFRATVLHNLAAVEMRTGRYSEALGGETEAIRLWQCTRGPDHPNLIRAYASLASLEYMMGQPHDARTAMERALASAARTYGPGHPLLADLLESDALILDRLKMKKQAQRERAQAREIRRGGAVAGDHSLTWDIREAADNQVHLRTK
jgi:tetratricopeptide (TPR) repeat protein